MPSTIQWDDDGDDSFLKDQEKSMKYKDPLTCRFLVSSLNEHPESMDLRCLVGLVVLITTESEKRANELLAAAVKAKAKTVIASASKKIGYRNETSYVAIKQHDKEVICQRF